MAKRANYLRLAPGAMQILIQQDAYLRNQFSSSKTINLTTWELVKLRVSQINHCAFCIDLHSKDALDKGESIERLIGLSTWKEMHIYSDTERAALEWAEILTSRVSVDNKIYSTAINALSEKAVVDLTIAINAINSWNQIAKTFKPEVGSYRSEI